MPKFLFLAVLALIVSSSCSNDDEVPPCTLPAADQNIIGKWSPTISEDVVEFRADGVLIDANDAILGFGDEEDTKTYEFVSGLDSIKVTATADSGFFSSTFKFTNEDCDVFKLGIIGISSEFRRVE